MHAASSCVRTSIRSPWQNGVAERWAGDRALRYVEAEHEEFAMDARRTL